MIIKRVLFKLWEMYEGKCWLFNQQHKYGIYVPDAQGSDDLAVLRGNLEVVKDGGNLQEAAHGRKQRLRNLQVRHCGKPTTAQVQPTQRVPSSHRANPLGGLLKSFCRPCSEDLERGVLSILKLDRAFKLLSVQGWAVLEVKDCL